MIILYFFSSNITDVDIHLLELFNCVTEIRSFCISGYWK